MTLLQAAKKGAAWMRWWINNYECDCEDGHTCGLQDRIIEMQEMERAIEDYKAVHKSSDPGAVK